NTTCLLDRHRNGDEAARNQLIDHACDRLRRHARKMLRGYPDVRRWDQTDDVLHNAVIRLGPALRAGTPTTSLHFLRLARMEIRRELLHLADKYQGQQVFGIKHHTDHFGADDRGGRLESWPGGEEPATLAEWGWFHEQVQALPEEEREVFGLIWYTGLSRQ